MVQTPRNINNMFQPKPQLPPYITPDFTEQWEAYAVSAMGGLEFLEDIPLNKYHFLSTHPEFLPDF